MPAAPTQCVLESPLTVACVPA